MHIHESMYRILDLKIWWLTASWCIEIMGFCVDAYVCVYMCMYLWLYSSVYICMYIWINVLSTRFQNFMTFFSLIYRDNGCGCVHIKFYMHVWIYGSMFCLLIYLGNICSYRDVYTYVRIYLYIYIYMYTSIQVRTYVWIHIYKYITIYIHVRNNIYYLPEEFGNLIQL
jgi:hypothetical protein